MTTPEMAAEMTGTETVEVVVLGAVGLCEQPMSERAVRAIMTDVLIACLRHG
jgi:hypothetical protein